MFLRERHALRNVKSGLAGVKGQEVDTPTVVVEEECEEIPPAPIHPRVTIVEEKKRVHLHAPAQTINSSSSTGEEPLLREPGNRLFAVTLRLRVSQIVSGIVMVLLGSVACLESSVRGTLGVGIPAGVLTVVASIANIQASRRYFATNMMNIHPQGSGNFGWGAQTPFGGPLRNFRPFLPTLACVLANLPLLALSCMAISSSDRNKYVLGWLLGSASLLVICTEAAVWYLRYRHNIRMTGS